MTQGQGAGLGHCCPLSGSLIFISPISQFVNDIFKSSVGSEIVSTISSSSSFFFIKVLILLFFKSAVVIVL